MSAAGQEPGRAPVQPAPTDAQPPPAEPVPGDPRDSPVTGWRPWTAPLALVGGIVLASVAALVVDLPAFLFGVQIESSHPPAGLTIADTIVQDAAFIVAAVYCGKIGGRIVRSWQFGLRPPAAGWRRAIAMIVALLVAFILLDAIWAEILKPSKEKLLETLGTKESTSLLVLSAALTCVVAPFGEEMLFRGYIFTALRNWRGTLPAALVTGILFGAVHVLSAPALDLVPLAALGFGLCLLYRYTGSLYVTIVAHAINNTIAFADLESWNFAQGLALGAGALVGVWLLVEAGKRAHLIAPAARSARPAA